MLLKLWFGVCCFLFFLQFKDVRCLKNVTLTVDPPIVQHKSFAILRCGYDLEGDVLYFVKWYRGQHEFYRYTPGDKPDPVTKVFPVNGLNVDMNRSNSTQVVLRDIEFNLAGNFSCEVTAADTPRIHIGTDTKSMVVVQLPEFPPKISVGHNAFDYGDILEANCTSSPSRPPASLTFMLNSFTVAQTPPRSMQERDWNDLSFKIELSEFHFDEGRLILKCIADVTEVYHEVAELELASARNPVPQRVRGYNSATTRPNVVFLVPFWILFVLKLL